MGKEWEKIEREIERERERGSERKVYMENKFKKNSEPPPGGSIKSLRPLFDVNTGVPSTNVVMIAGSEGPVVRQCKFYEFCWGPHNFRKYK